MADLEAYAAWFVDLAEYENEDAVALVTVGGRIVVRYGDAKTAQSLMQRALREMQAPEGVTLQ